jgi:hypothetical protein
MTRPGWMTSELHVGLGIHAATGTLIYQAAVHGHYGWAVAALAVSGLTHAVYQLGRAVAKAVDPLASLVALLWTFRATPQPQSPAPGASPAAASADSPSSSREEMHR